LKATRLVSAAASAAVAVFLGTTFTAPAQAYPPGQGVTLIGSHVHALVNEPIIYIARHLKPGASVLIKFVGTTKGKTVKANADGVATVTLSPDATGVYSVIAKSKNETTARTTLYVPDFSFATGPAAPAGSTNTFVASKLRPFVVLTFRIAGKEYTTRVNHKGNASIDFKMPVKKRQYNPPVFINSKWIGSGHETESLRIRSR
jgi:hypothetical protein